MDDDLVHILCAERLLILFARFFAAALARFVMQNAQNRCDAERHRRERRDRDPRRNAGQKSVKFVPAALLLAHDGNYHIIDAGVDEHRDHRFVSEEMVLRVIEAGECGSAL